MSDSKAKISIVDYGVGNLHSLVKAFKQYGTNVIITEETGEIKSSDAVVLPGVGSFSAGMEGLGMRKLADTIREYAQSDKPMLGICLGAQILLTKGYEFGIWDGLDIIKGEVLPFPKIEQGFKMPHIGWNKIYAPEGNSWSKTILNSTGESEYVYFIHSYFLKPNNAEDVLSMTSYGGFEFCSAVKKGNIYGCQFHPEKSGEVGLNIIKEFVGLLK